VSSMEREPTAEEREKTGSATRVAKRGGEGGLGKCSRDRRVTTLSFVVAIFGRHEELVSDSVVGFRPI
jgi:hypothetical protein